MWYNLVNIKTMLMKFFRYFSAVALAMSLALPAAAATGPWSWEDISSKIPAKRDGWRITAVGHFGLDWYFTNGKELTSNGKVWKLWPDGKVTEVTGSLKKAGLTRVDSIVSRATSIAYLQKGTAGSVKSASWNGTNISDQGYEDDKLTGADEQLWDGIADIKLMAGDKDNGIVVGNAEAGGPVSVFRYVLNGQINDISDQLAVVPNTEWNDAMAAWNGASWMIVANHDLIRFDGEKLEYYGHTRDKFTSITAMTDGTYLLGGGTTDKTTKAKLVRVTEQLPLTTATTGTIESAPVPTVETAPAAPVVTTFLWSTKPMNMTQGKRLLTSAVDGSYGVTATNANGVKKLELLVNGEVKNTCVAEGKKQIYCRIALKASDYPKATKLDVMARATDANDQTSEGANETYWTE